MTDIHIFTWDGEAMQPRRPKLADETFVVGEVYRMEVREERGVNTHRHYFASIKEAWLNLPDLDAERFPTPEHLRKHALIKAGWRDERTLVAASKPEALRIAAFMRPRDEYSIVLVRDAVVVEYTAKSQSLKAMGRKDFQASKQAVLDTVAGMVGVTAGQIADNAGRP